jgi:hypothetical protein
MIAIKCKNGRTFVGINESFLDAETKLQIAYYKSQDCLIEVVETVKFEPPHDCKHCSSLEHKFEELIEELKSE